ncbi:MAG: hypothetical protein JO225_04795, partial [Candidatus Eremiobacteraeota bacterium]|nr:hypothetical protein [Candidatus Eremiobacteraeota bacterium]
MRLCFRTPNIGAAPSPPALVRFELPEVLEALDDTAVAIAPVAPGDDLYATVRARATRAAAHARTCPVRAVLELPATTLAANVCTVTVVSSAVLDGPASGVTVEAAGPGVVRVRATVTNEGDGPARDVRVVVPPPPGCEPLDGGLAIRDAAALDAGETIEVAFDARLVAPAQYVAVDDAAVWWNRTESSVLRENAGVMLEPVLAAPVVDVAGERTGAELRVTLRNDGWCDAPDVGVEIVLPAGMRAADDAVRVDGVVVRARARDAAGGFAIAQVRRAGSSLHVALARVPARESIAIAVTLRAGGPSAGGDAIVRVAEHELRARCVPAALRNVGLRALLRPAAVAPGERANVCFEVLNAGDRPERISLAGSGVPLLPPQRTLPLLAPGMLATASFELEVPEDATDGETLAVLVDACDAGAVLSQLELALPVRDRAHLVVEGEPQRAHGAVRYRVRNLGSSTAHNARAHVGDEVHDLAPLAPGESGEIVASERAARLGGTLRCGAREVAVLAASEPPRTAQPSCELRAGDAVAGAPVTLHLRLTVPESAETVVIRVPGDDAAPYAAGSTILDGRPLLDRGGGAPLAGAGLALHAVPAGTALRVEWTVVP